MLKNLKHQRVLITQEPYHQYNFLVTKTILVSAQRKVTKQGLIMSSITVENDSYHLTKHQTKFLKLKSKSAIDLKTKSGLLASKWNSNHFSVDSFIDA